MTDWVEGRPPIENYRLPVGIEVEVQHVSGGETYRYLVGNVNPGGGECDCCQGIDVNGTSTQYIRWRRVWTPEE